MVLQISAKVLCCPHCLKQELQHLQDAYLHVLFLARVGPIRNEQDVQPSPDTGKMVRGSFLPIGRITTVLCDGIGGICFGVVGQGGAGEGQFLGPFWSRRILFNWGGMRTRIRYRLCFGGACGAAEQTEREKLRTLRFQEVRFVSY